jgi:isopenicillin N synthase-like dioxygenase
MRESSPEDRMRTARAIRSACIDIGFFYATGHGFTPAELEAVLTQGRNFFALPLPEKMKVLSQDVNTPGFVRTGGLDPEKIATGPGRDCCWCLGYSRAGRRWPCSSTR